MTAKEYFDSIEVQALFDLPEGVIALKEVDLYIIMEAYSKYRIMETVGEAMDEKIEKKAKELFNELSKENME